MISSREKLVLAVALSAVALLAAGSFLWRSNPSPADPPLGPGAAYDLSTYAQARSVGEYRLISQGPSLPRAYCIAVGTDGRVAVGGDGKVILGALAAWCEPQRATHRFLDTRDLERWGPFGWDGVLMENPISTEGGRSVGQLSELSVPVLFAEQQTDGRVLSLAFGDDGALFVGLRGGVAVLRHGRWEKLFERPGSQIVSLVVADDMIFATDAATRSVMCRERNGRLIREIAGERERGSAGFVLPSPHWAMAMGPDGLLRIANPGRRRVEAWTVDGHREFVWGQAGPGVGQFSGCCNPAALAVLDDGRIITAEKGDLLTVTVYAPDGPQTGTAGQVACVVAGPDCFRREDGAVAVAVMPGGVVLVLQTPGGVLSVFEPPKEGQ